jgi:hypothetical protein
MKRILRQLLPAFMLRQLSAIKALIKDKVVGGVVRIILRGSILCLNPLLLQQTLDEAGYSVARKKDYYSPLPSIAALRKNRARWDKPSGLQGIDCDVDKMKSLFSQLVKGYLEEFSGLPPHAALRLDGFGPGYGPVDALTLYMMLRHVKPRRYLEVGSGLSTYYASLAAEKNAREGFPLEVTCVEPNPYEALYSIKNISIIKSEAQSVEPSLFKGLQNNDVLFIDSSHILKIDGDVAYLLLEILPSLAPGVVIHVHDVPFPYNTPYPASLWLFALHWPMFWNEAMVLQAFLCYNSAFKVMLSTPLIRHVDEDFLRAHIPNYQPVEQDPNTFSSIWLRRGSL